MSEAQTEVGTFVSWLITSEGYTHVAIAPGDLEYWGVKQLLFHWTLIRGAVGDYECYDDRYCYATEVGAKDALDQLKANNWTGEPLGWHRHPKTGRRRTGGDPATEYIDY
jgi:hypothetical protein